MCYSFLRFEIWTYLCTKALENRNTRIKLAKFSHFVMSESWRCKLYFQLFFSILCLSTCLSMCAVFSVSWCLKSFLLGSVQALQLHRIVYSKWVLDLSAIIHENQMGSQWKRKGTEADKYAVCYLLHNSTALLLVSTPKCKRVAMQDLTSSKL